MGPLFGRVHRELRFYLQLLFIHLYFFTSVIFLFSEAGITIKRGTFKVLRDKPPPIETDEST